MDVDKSSRIVGYLRIIMVILFLIVVGLYTATYILFSSNSQLYFLSSSLILVGIAFLNLLFTHLKKDDKWFRYVLFFFIAMLCGFIGDLMMGGVIYLTSITILNGIIFFGIGHVFYILGLKDKSSLLFNSESSIFLRNLAVLISCWAATIALFFFTVFDPYDVILSVGALCYGVLLATALAFAITKFFDNFPILFKVVLFLGFLLFLYSDWVLGVRYFASSDFLSGFVVGISYIIGQFLIHLSPIYGSVPEGESIELNE